MLNCPECNSEHVFAATCLTCGHVIGSPSYDVSWSGHARTGATTRQASDKTAPQNLLKFEADHYVGFNIDEARSRAPTPGTTAALHTPTLGAMAKDAKNKPVAKGKP